MYLLGLRHIFILLFVLFGNIFAPPGKPKNTDVCDGVLYYGMCYWTESPPGGKKPVNCSGGELAWVSDNQTWQFITTHLDTELRTYLRLNLGINSTSTTGTQINTNEWFTVYGERVNWTDPNLKKNSNSFCVVLTKDGLKNKDCDNGMMSLCQSSNVSACYNRTTILDKCYWKIPDLKDKDSSSIYTKERECVRLGGTLAVPESKNISDSLSLEFSNDKYYIGMVNSLWYDIYTGQRVQNHFWYKGVDNDECAVMRDRLSIYNWGTRSCSSTWSSFSGLCAKDIEKGEVCPENHTSRNMSDYIRCFWLTSSVKKMESAKQLCEHSGGFLTYGQNDDEQIFLSNFLDAQNENYVWIGITTNKRRWYNSKGEQTWFNWKNSYSQDNCVTFSGFDDFKWSVGCSEPVIPGLTTSAPKKGPGGRSGEASMTTGNLCMKEDSRVISTTVQTTTTVENPTTTKALTTSDHTTNSKMPTTKAQTSSGLTTQAQTSSEPTPQAQTRSEPTTEIQTSTDPTTETQTSSEPTTDTLATPEPTTEAQTTTESTTQAPTSSEPTIEVQTTLEPTTKVQTSQDPTTQNQTSHKTTTEAQTSSEPTTEAQTSSEPTTKAQTTPEPTTKVWTPLETPEISSLTSSEPITVPTTSPKMSVLPDPSTFKPLGFTKPILTKDDRCLKIIVDSESKKSWSINCLCPCKRRKSQVQTLNKQTIEKLQEETKKKLIVSQKSISAVTQKKISLPDKRVSSTTIGTASTATIIGILLTLVVADLIKVFLELKRKIRYISNPY